MDTGGYVRLLGRASVQLGDRSIDFLPNKRFQLLAYLAYQGDWISRDKLAFLFWPDETDHTARHNLRQLLKHVRKMAWLEGFEADEYRLRWAVDTDVASFNEALQEGNVEQTPSLYQGPLLPNLEGDGEGEFGEWLAMEREGLHGRWRGSLFGRVEELTRSGNHDAAAGLLRTLLERDPLDEEGVQAYMRSAAKAGHQQQALSAYRSFAKRLRSELQMEPTSVSEQLAKEIEDAPPPPPPRVTGVPAQVTPAPDRSPAVATATRVTSSLPKPATSFVGRDLELAEVAHLLSHEDCRLLTLTGAGGAGKTRLALQAAQEFGQGYPDGVYFVPLDSLTSATSIPTALANVLNLELRGQEEPLEQVIGFLHGNHALLVLDNYEHLLEGATITSELLQGCSNLKLLVTSRERLNVEEEWLLPIEGLSYPKDADSLEKAFAHDAVQLFTQRAKRVQPSFTPTEEELPHMIEVCRLVQGFPLGIELAAAWVRAMPVEEIAREIGRDYDFLSSTSRNVADRHRSIRAAFEYSWRLLSDKEQDVLRKLSVFRGGFTKEAAAYVADASHATLAALVDKSLLRVSPLGRYDRHPLMYQYTLDKLIDLPDEWQETRDRHGTYYFSLLRQGEDNTLQKKTHMEELDPELDNIRFAWKWAVEERKLRDLESAYDLKIYFVYRARYQEFIEFCADAAASLNESDPAHHAALGTLFAMQAWPFHHLGRYEEAVAVAEHGVRLLHPLRKTKPLLTALNALEGVAWSKGNYIQAKKYAKEALVLARTLPEPEQSALALCNAGLVELEIGDYQHAEQYLAEALTLYREHDARFGIAHVLHLLGWLHLYTDNLDDALRLLKESLHLSQSIGAQYEIPYIFCNIAETLLDLGNTTEAQSFCREGLQKARDNKSRSTESWMLTNMGRVAAALGDHDEARQFFVQSLKLALSIDETPRALNCVMYFAELMIRENQTVPAREYLEVVKQHPATKHRLRDKAEVLLKNAQAQLFSVPCTEMYFNNTANTLEEVVAAIVGITPAGTSQNRFC